MDTTDEVQISRGQRKAELRGQILKEHVRNVLGTVAGRAVLWHILGQCNLYGTSYDPDRNLVDRKEGRRDVGLEILAMLEMVRPHAHVELMQEAKSIEAQEREENND
jgi:hypothetical protein